MISGPTSLAYPAPQNGARLITLDPSAGYITIINMYAVAPERADALWDLLIRPTAETINFHINFDVTQVINYAQRQSREAAADAGADPKVADGFTPILYELHHSVVASMSENC
jgi:hypothetical protein